MHTHTHARMHARMHAHIHSHTHTHRIHTHEHMHMYTCIYVHTHACIYSVLKYSSTECMHVTNFCIEYKRMSLQLGINGIVLMPLSDTCIVQSGVCAWCPQVMDIAIHCVDQNVVKSRGLQDVFPALFKCVPRSSLFTLKISKTTATFQRRCEDITMFPSQLVSIPHPSFPMNHQQSLTFCVNIPSFWWCDYCVSLCRYDAKSPPVLPHFWATSIIIYHLFIITVI